jgi:uncharacterized membrane protein
MKKYAWIIVGVLSTLIGLYPIKYLIVHTKFGLFTGKSAELLSNTTWNIIFYTHIFIAGISLLIGWLQFSQRLRKKNIKLHRIIGKVYVISALISGITGLYLAFFATGGIISTLGFASLAVTWLYTTYFAYTTIKKGKIKLHENLMIYSYAACFGAVTLRLWLPILTQLFDEFIVAYRIVSWLAWVPNILVAYFLVNKKKSRML